MQAMTSTTSTIDIENIQCALDDLGIFEDDTTITLESVEEKTQQETDTAFLTSAERFCRPSEHQMELLQAKIAADFAENHGEFILDLSTPENMLTSEKLEMSLATLARLAKMSNFELAPIHRITHEKGETCSVLVRRLVAEGDFSEIRVAVVGNVDAGKSSLLGVLTHNELDDGRGKSRTKLFRHKHEQETGRTSSIAHLILGFDGQGKVVNKPEHDGTLNWEKLCNQSSKIVTFIDLAGHEKYLKTTVFGMVGQQPDYVLLLVGANAGLIGMSKEHLGLALALNVPVICVVTKVDMAPPNVLQDTMKLLQKILRSPGCRKTPLIVNNTADVLVAAQNLKFGKICPIFQVSNVTGHNIDLLRSCLNLLTPRYEGDVTAPAEFRIDNTYNVPGVGVVVSGLLLHGRVGVNDTLLLGPSSTGEFMEVGIRGIHRHRMPTQALTAGQMGTLALKKIKKASVRTGMVLVHPSLKPFAVREFEAEVMILHHHSTISKSYQAMIHCGCIRQTAAIVHMETDSLRTGDRAKVRFRFIRLPEFLKVGDRFVFREGRTKAVGTITHMVPDEKAKLASSSKGPKIRTTDPVPLTPIVSSVV